MTQTTVKRGRVGAPVYGLVAYGFLIVFWATPEMSYGRLLFAVLGTGYILVAVRFEEHDLREHLGEQYEEYTRRVPRFVPSPSRTR